MYNDIPIRDRMRNAYNNLYFSTTEDSDHEVLNQLAFHFRNRAENIPDTFDEFDIKDYTEELVGIVKKSAIQVLDIYFDDMEKYPELTDEESSDIEKDFKEFADKTFYSYKDIKGFLQDYDMYVAPPIAYINLLKEGQISGMDEYTKTYEERLLNGDIDREYEEMLKNDKEFNDSLIFDDDLDDFLDYDADVEFDDSLVFDDEYADFSTITANDMETEVIKDITSSLKALYFKDYDLSEEDIDDIVMGSFQKAFCDNDIALCDNLTREQLRDVTIEACELSFNDITQSDNTTYGSIVIRQMVNDLDENHKGFYKSVFESCYEKGEPVDINTVVSRLSESSKSNELDEEDFDLEY